MNETELRSEKIEKEALISLHKHCPPEAAKAIGLYLLEVDDALAAAAVNDPSVVINRTLGLGTANEISEKTIKNIKGFYRDLLIKKYFLHIYPDELPENGNEILDELGFQKSRGWMKFSRDNSPAPNAPTELEIREASTTEEATHFGRIVASAFGMTELSAPMLAGLYNDPAWYIFLSYSDDSPAGAGAMYVSGESAWMEWGATDPNFRRRGSQAAIMAARIQKAIELGCKQMFTETGEAVEGDPQHSYKNILKAGFKESVLRENYTPKI
ncbi:MAG: GNAT family N-acetyltransferase [Thermodesulfobacteriota bacterium]